MFFAILLTLTKRGVEMGAESAGFPGPFEILEKEIELRTKELNLEINAYFGALAENAKELRKDNNSLNDAEIISGKYKNDILKIIEKYFPDGQTVEKGFPGER